MRDEYTCSGWACTDCIVLIANGDAPAGMSETEVAEWQSRIDENTTGFNVVPGMLREDHDCAVNYTVTAYRYSRSWIARLRCKTSKRYAARWIRAFEYRADDTDDVLGQHEFGSDSCDYPEIISVTAHDLETESDRGGECFCEQDSFSMSPCDVCGGNLGGERHAVSFFKIIPD